MRHNQRVASQLGKVFQSHLLEHQGARGYATQLAIRGADALKAGAGGRSSVSGVTATIFGCSGFVGRYVAQSLGSLGSQIVLPYRCDDTAVQHLRTMGDLGMVVPLGDFDVRDDEALRRAMSRSNLVINLIGAEVETWNYTFEEVHTDIPARMAKIAKELGVERFIHFSALGAETNAPSRRLRSKAAGDDAVRSELGDVATIFKPAVITGTEDRLFNRYAGWVKTLPFLPLIDGGRNKLQPVWVRDVAQAVMNSLHTYDSMGKTYHLAGPDVFTVKELVQFTYDTVREETTTLHIPAALARLANAPRDWIAKRTPFRASAPFTADGLAELDANVLLPSGPGILKFEDLDVEPHRVTEGVPIEYLRHYRSGGYDFGTTAPDASTSGSAGFRSSHHHT